MVRSHRIDPIGPPIGMSQLNFHGPLSDARAGRLVERLSRANPKTVLDLGCGWGELMLRVLAKLPDATGFEVDVDEDDLASGARNADMRGASDRLQFLHNSGIGATFEPPDLVVLKRMRHTRTPQMTR
jgi:methylase of polypeptide subunit release factors